jgi:hypothetical protein
MFEAAVHGVDGKVNSAVQKNGLNTMDRVPGFISIGSAYEEIVPGNRDGGTRCQNVECSAVAIGRKESREGDGVGRLGGAVFRQAEGGMRALLAELGIVG